MPLNLQVIAQILIIILVCQNFASIGATNIPSPPAFNLSHFLFPRVSYFSESTIPIQPPQFLQGVLDAIAKKEKWVVEDIRASEVDIKKAKYGPVKRYEFRIQVDQSKIVLKMYEEVTEWNKMAGLVKNRSLDFEALVKEIGSKVLIDSFNIEGPFELRVVGPDDQLSLMLPTNISYANLRRISVGEGITVEVRDAEEISLIHPPDSHHRLLDEVGSIWPSKLCTSLLPIHITGSASVIAYRSRKPTSHINAVFSSKDEVELLPEKCYVQRQHPKARYLFSSFLFLEKFLRIFSSNTKPVFGSLKSRIRESIVFHFQLQLERLIRRNDTYWSALPEWRTRPVVERVWFEVDARMEDGGLKPIVIKKVRPFVDVDSFASGSLLSNLSFTKLPALLVPPEALTLDVKW